MLYIKKFKNKLAVKEVMKIMTNKQEARLKELQENDDRTEGEQKVHDALVALSESSKVLATAKNATPVVDADVASAQKTFDAASTAVADAEKGLDEE